MHWLLAVLIGYGLGSIPGSWLVARGAGVDLRQLGDGNPGAHNVSRNVGRGWGMLALAIDAAKGAAAVLLTRWFGDESWPVVVAGLAAVLGHNYPVWLRFRGGKGLATSAGVVLAIVPGLWWLTIGSAIVVIALTRNLAFSGLAVGVVLALVAAWLRLPAPLIAAPPLLLLLLLIAQLPDLVQMWRAAPSKRDLILNRWIRDREAKL